MRDSAARRSSLLAYEEEYLLYPPLDTDGELQVARAFAWAVHCHYSNEDAPEMVAEAQAVLRSIQDAADPQWTTYDMIMHPLKNATARDET